MGKPAKRASSGASKKGDARSKPKEELEPSRRGLYGGAVGYLGYDGNLDTAITIRSAVLREGQAHVHTGAGIVAGSVPEKEFDETEHKAAALRRAIEQAVAPAEAPRARAAFRSSPRASRACPRAGPSRPEPAPRPWA